MQVGWVRLQRIGGVISVCWILRPAQMLRQGFQVGDEAVEFPGVVEPRLVVDLLVLADLAGHGLAADGAGPGEVEPV